MTGKPWNTKCSELLAYAFTSLCANNRWTGAQCVQVNFSLRDGEYCPLAFKAYSALGDHPKMFRFHVSKGRFWTRICLGLRIWSQIWTQIASSIWDFAVTIFEITILEHYQDGTIFLIRMRMGDSAHTTHPIQAHELSSKMLLEISLLVAGFWKDYRFYVEITG